MDEQINEENKPRLGVANVLPEIARDILVAAYQQCQAYPVESIERKRIIERAIESARIAAHSYFKRSSTN